VRYEQFVVHSDNRCPGKAVDRRLIDVNVTEPTADAIAAAPFDFEGTFHRHFAAVARIIARVVGDRDRAQDLAIETFWKLWRTPAAHKGDASAWLYRVAVRAALDELRKRARRSKYELLFGLAHLHDTTDHAGQVIEEQQRVRSVLAVMKSTHAQLLMLRSAGFTYPEMAECLQLSSNSIGTLLGRAEQTFRKEYVKRYGEFRG